ncbi:hypothetical protein [Sinanaerobacter sp. ZZT-01]|uniref:hypothetical protein n=1 Tax=Sinanaerobacter sp. ZZT-01 TaxID=3111540 RepID=UPI002D79FEDC|nr:hypothetical protein [Sinanaerobacter sp. ZZT-01]WRR93406.1 hypothetical protein U5921_15460 [Sinanaerobacter sp. ZZT-01]
MDYKMIPEDGQYSLYRKLEENEGIYYIEELDRLKKIGNDIWLHLKSGSHNEIQRELNELQNCPKLKKKISNNIKNIFRKL